MNNINKYLISYDIECAENYNEVKELFFYNLQQHGRIEEKIPESTIVLHTSHSKIILHAYIEMIIDAIKKQTGASIKIAFK